MATQDEAKRRFIELCKEFSMRAKEIDRMTPWSETEPQWWLDMMEIRRLTQRSFDAETGVAKSDGESTPAVSRK